MRALLSLLAMTLPLVAGPAQALTIELPDCVTETGVEYDRIEEMTGGLRLALRRSEGTHELVLARCAGGSQAVISHADNHNGPLLIARGSIVEMIAARESYTFEDVARRFDHSGYASTVSRTKRDGCICAQGGN